MTACSGGRLAPFVVIGHPRLRLSFMHAQGGWGVEKGGLVGIV